MKKLDIKKKMKMKKIDLNKKLTFIEVLILLAIIGVLLALLMPAIG